MTELTEACAAIAAWLPEAFALITEPDADGTTGSGQPDSRPPWNQAAADAALDAIEAIERLEASLRRDVAGHPGPRRAGYGTTGAAIKAIENLGGNPRANPVLAAAALDRRTRRIQELTAIDQAEPWRRLSGVACPYCHHPMLRVRPRQGIVTCLRHGACSDEDGRHPIGRIDIGQLTGNPVIRWNDGLVT
jgi:hypothetical protein